MSAGMIAAAIPTALICSVAHQRLGAVCPVHHEHAAHHKHEGKIPTQFAELAIVSNNRLEFEAF